MVDSRKPTIAVIGSLNYDLVSLVPRLPKAGETLTSKSFSTNCGGKGANQAVAAARFANKCESVNVMMIGAVGKDEFGGQLKEGLKEQGVDVQGVREVDGNSGVAVIVVEEGTGENRIMISPGANDTVAPSTLPSYISYSQSTSDTGITPDLLVLQLEIPLETVRHIIQFAPSSRPPVLFNPAPAVPLPLSIYPHVDVLVVNETEAALLTGISFGDDPERLKQAASEAIDWFVSHGAQNVVITLGAQGAVLSEGSTRAKDYVPANNVPKVVDTTGAGDTFVGVLAVLYVQSKTQQTPFNLQQAVCRATDAAAWSVAHRGTWDAMPLGRELDVP